MKKKNFWQKMTRRRLVRIASFLTALVLVLGISAFAAESKAEYYENSLENDYQRAFAQLVAAVESVDASLQKCSLATSPAMLSVICTEIYGKSNLALANLSELPFSTTELENTAGFLSKVGDYALALSKSAAVGDPASRDRQDNLIALSDTATVLAQNLSELQTLIYSGQLNIGKLYSAANVADSAEENAVDLGASISGIEKEFPEIPALIYDGPFSEHIQTREAQMLKDQLALEDKELIKTAADFFNLREEAFQISTTTDGDFETVYLTAKVDGGEMSVQLSRNGGLVLDMFNSRTVSTSQLSADTAVTKAEDFLKTNGINDMQYTYYQINDNVLVTNFAYVQDGVICYPDLIKVSVAMDTGRLVGYEASGYIANHVQRQFEPTSVDQAAAAEKLSPRLKVLSHSMALIPSAGKNEVLCHEFKCELEDGRHYILYVNAQTGNEEQILILLEDETGTLTL